MQGLKGVIVVATLAAAAVALAAASITKGLLQMSP